MSDIINRAVALLNAPMAWSDFPHEGRKYIPCGTSGQAISVRLVRIDLLREDDIRVVHCDWGDADAAQQHATLPDAAALAYELSNGAVGYPSSQRGAS